MLAQSVNILKIYYEKLITVIAFERRLGVTGGTLKTVYPLIPFEASYVFLYYKYYKIFNQLIKIINLHQ